MAAGSGNRTGTKKSTGTAGSSRSTARSTGGTGAQKRTGSTGSSGRSSAGRGGSQSGRSRAGSGSRAASGNRAASRGRAGTGGKTGKRGQTAAARRRQRELYQEAAFIVVCVFLAFLFLCNFGVAGPVGNFFKGIMFGLFGLTAYGAPVVIAAGVVYWWSNRGQGAAYQKIIPGFLLLIDAGAFCELFAKRLETMDQYSIAALYRNSEEYWNGGGALGGSLAYVLYHFLSTVGAVLILLALALICVVLLTEKSFVGLMQSLGTAAGSTVGMGAESARRRAEERAEEKRSRRERKVSETDDRDEEEPQEKRGGFFPWVHMLSDNKSGRGQKSAAPGEDDRTRGEKDPSLAHTTVSGVSKVVTGQDAAFHKNSRASEPVVSAPVQERAEPEEPEADRSALEFDGVRELTRRRTYYQQETWPVPGEGEAPRESSNRNAGVEVWQGTLDRSAGAQVFQLEARPGTGGLNAGAQGIQESGLQEPDEELPPGEYVQREIPREILYGEGGSDPAGQSSAGSGQRPKAALPQNRSSGVSASGVGAAANSTANSYTAAREYRFPPLSFLNPGKPGRADSSRELEETARRLRECLETFGVRVTITDISKGPAVTRYEIQPEQGVKVSKIVNLSDDIKLNLAATDIRIEAPIPGKAAIGIEVPNRENSPVPLRDLLESKEYQSFHSKLAFAVGKDISGKVVVTDIAKMPHVLIAGATGSGKSVCINTIILSLIYKATPEEVQMIMIDPKVVELNIYNGIPHLMIPVVTDPKKAAAALHWGVAEMMDRYEKFAQMGVRDLKGYNARVESLKTAEDGTPLRKLPQIVIIVDELADLMMVSPGEVEESICRLAQLARAAGIHLIIATQRPSVDVITGLIKANMPSRIAFSVTSGVDSRTILDMNGAEKLLGKGDMLFYPQGYAKPTRIQGAFVTEEEIQRVVDFLKNQKLGNAYQADIEEKMKNLDSSAGADGQSAGQAAADSRDVLFAEAGRFIIQKDMEKSDKPPSIGMLQRAFKIGFNRAARIMDQLCEYGVVSEAEGTRPRKLLMNMEQFEQLLEEI